MSIGSLGAEVRRSQLRDALERTGAVDLAWAAEECGVSEMTIRRDLAELERLGLVKRVRGGAVSVEPERFDRRVARSRSAKLRISAKLQPLLPAHGFVALDSSSTLHFLATELAPSAVTVVTTGIETFQAVRGKVARAILAGGELEESTGAFVGPVAQRTIADFQFARTFLSVSGIDVDAGALESTLENAEVKRALRRVSSSVVVAADSTKLGLASAAVALRLDQIDLLVTELDPEDPQLDAYRDRVELL